MEIFKISHRQSFASFFQVLLLNRYNETKGGPFVLKRFRPQRSDQKLPTNVFDIYRLGGFRTYSKIRNPKFLCFVSGQMIYKTEVFIVCKPEPKNIRKDDVFRNFQSQPIYHQCGGCQLLVERRRRSYGCAQLLQ